MESPNLKSSQLIAFAYERYQKAISLYIYYRIGCKDEAADLTQDVFLRLMEYRQLVCEATIKCFLYTIARNLVIDQLRRYYKRDEYSFYVYHHSSNHTCETESKVIANDLLHCEHQKLQQLSIQRRKVYEMSRFEEKSISEISGQLNLSLKTVESHLFSSRREVRSYIRMCI